MARPVKRKGGSWRYQPTLPDGRRGSISIPRCSQRIALKVCTRIDELIDCASVNEQPPAELRVWLDGISDQLHASLARCGLVRNRVTRTLSAFLDEEIDDHTLKASSRTRKRIARNRLVEYFGHDKPIREITREDALAWHRWMLEDKGYADNTVARDVGFAREFMKSAIGADLIAENPFDGLSSAIRSNQDRMHFVDRETFTRVMDAMEDEIGRALFVAARIGGLRIPSEIRGMRWSDVMFDRDRVRVLSPKTEHKGRGMRFVPLFPELRAAFEDLGPGPGDELVFAQLSPFYHKIIRGILLAAIERAGLDPWPKLFTNLRSSRLTECRDLPEHLLSAWFGNSQAIRQLYYMQTRDEDYARAAFRDGAESGADSAGHGLTGEDKTPKRTPDPAIAGQDLAKGGRYWT